MGREVSDTRLEPRAAPARSSPSLRLIGVAQRSPELRVLARCSGIDVACCSVGCEAPHPFSAKQRVCQVLGTHAWAIPPAPRCSAGGLQRVLSARATAVTKVLPLHARALYAGCTGPMQHLSGTTHQQGVARNHAHHAYLLGLPQILHLHVPRRCSCLPIPKLPYIPTHAHLRSSALSRVTTARLRTASTAPAAAGQRSHAAQHQPSAC